MMRRSLRRLSAGALQRQRDLILSAIRMLRREQSRAFGGLWQAASREAAMVSLRAGLADLSRRQAVALGEDLAKASTVSWRDAGKYLRAADKAYLGAARPLRFEAAAWIDRERRLVGQTRLANYSRSLARYGADLSQQLEVVAARTAMLGRSWNSAIDEIAGELRARAHLKDWQIRRLVETEVSAAYNQIQLDALLEEDSPDDPMWKRLVAVFDKRTGRDSVMLHGQARPVREPFYDAMHGRHYQAPPNRPHDREIVVGWRKGYGRFPAASPVEQKPPPKLRGAAPRAPAAPGTRAAKNLRPGDVLARPGRPTIERVVERKGGRIAAKLSTGQTVTFAGAEAVLILG